MRFPPFRDGMRVITQAAELFSGPSAEHGEGPIWCVADARLRWVDMLRGDVLSANGRGDNVERTHVGEVAAALRPRSRGGYVVAIERGFGFLDETFTPLRPLWEDESVRMNDGSCDVEGRFYCGSMAWNASPGRGSLYRMDLEGHVSCVLTGVTVSNGLVFSPDGSVALYVDSATSEISRVRLNGTREDPWCDRQTFVAVDPAIGTPDGICLDAQGGVWVALWNGGAVRRYDHTGNLTHVVTVPVRNPTACTLGGSDLSTLFITTSKLGEDDEPDAGAVFAARVEIKGSPALPYRG